MTVHDKQTKVLIGEDDDDDYLIFSIAIAEVPYKVLLSRAATADVLLVMLNAEMPDMLFLDLRMPGKDGRHCLHEIRSQRRYDKLPVIMYTSMDDLQNIEYCYREGSNAYTIKPSSLVELKVILNRLLAIDWTRTTYYPPFEDFVIRGSAG